MALLKANTLKSSEGSIPYPYNGSSDFLALQGIGETLAR